MTYSKKIPGYLRTSEIGKRTTVLYRAKMLGIKPLEEKGFWSENLYSVEDADRIMSYSVKRMSHSIKHFKVLEEILSNDKFLYNTILAANYFALKESKIRDMIREYNKSGCFIVASKINQDE